MGRRPLLPNAENCSCTELNTAAKAAPTQSGFVRMTAIRKLLEGWNPQTVAAFYDVTRQTLRNWITSFNERGIDGLIDKPRTGAPRKITSKQSDTYENLLKNPQLADVTHWTGVKFHGYLRSEFEHEIGYSTVVRWLHDKGFRLKVPQPWSDRQDEQAREKFLEELGKLLLDETIDLWYQDESGFEGDPRPRRRWVQKGEKTRIPYSGTHIRMNVAGLVCPRTGYFFALEFTHMDSDVFQIFLNYANSDCELPRKKNVIILDNASWHKKKSLDWGQFIPVYLPPYSPDLNPIEKLWLIVKAEWFSDFYAKNRDQLIERIDMALIWLMKRKDGNRKTCRINA